MTKARPKHDPNAVYTPLKIDVDVQGNILPSGEDDDYKFDQETLWHYDALYHWFDLADTVDSATKASSHISPSEQVARLLTQTYDPNVAMESFTSCVTQYQEPDWRMFRDRASFLVGDIIPGGTVDATIAWTREYHGKNMIVLDAENYYKDYANGEYSGNGVRCDDGDFSDLMHIANNQKKIIEEGIATDFANSARDAIRFINAEPHEHIFSDDDGRSTKWLIEGKYLADALVKIPVFRRNYNLIVVTNAMRYILAGEVNLNNLYRLMAKLGRINTRLVFLG